MPELAVDGAGPVRKAAQSLADALGKLAEVRIRSDESRSRDILGSLKALARSGDLNGVLRGFEEIDTRGLDADAADSLKADATRIAFDAAMATATGNAAPNSNFFPKEVLRIATKIGVQKEFRSELAYELAIAMINKGPANFLDARKAFSYITDERKQQAILFRLVYRAAEEHGQEFVVGKQYAQWAIQRITDSEIKNLLGVNLAHRAIQEGYREAAETTLKLLTDNRLVNLFKNILPAGRPGKAAAQLSGSNAASIEELKKQEEADLEAIIRVKEDIRRIAADDIEPSAVREEAA